jgi:hypothetical protein
MHPCIRGKQNNAFSCDWKSFSPRASVGWQDREHRESQQPRQAGEQGLKDRRVAQQTAFMPGPGKMGKL